MWAGCLLRTLRISTTSVMRVPFPDPGLLRLLVAHLYGSFPQVAVVVGVVVRLLLHRPAPGVPRAAVLVVDTLPVPRAPEVQALAMVVMAGQVVSLPALAPLLLQTPSWLASPRMVWQLPRERLRVGLKPQFLRSVWSQLLSSARLCYRRRRCKLPLLGLPLPRWSQLLSFARPCRHLTCKRRWQLLSCSPSIMRSNREHCLIASCRWVRRLQLVSPPLHMWVLRLLPVLPTLHLCLLSRFSPLSLHPRQTPTSFISPVLVPLPVLPVTDICWMVLCELHVTERCLNPPGR